VHTEWSAGECYVTSRIFTTRCTAKRGIEVALRLSVCNVGVSGAHKLEILKTNCTHN